MNKIKDVSLEGYQWSYFLPYEESQSLLRRKAQVDTEKNQRPRILMGVQGPGFTYLSPSFKLPIAWLCWRSGLCPTILINRGSTCYSSNTRQDAMNKTGTAEDKCSLPKFISYLITYSITNSQLWLCNRNARILNIVNKYFVKRCFCTYLDSLHWNSSLKSKFHLDCSSNLPSGAFKVS